MTLFHRNIDEINEKKELKYIFWLLNGINFVVALFWLNKSIEPLQASEAICWPFFNQCQALPHHLTGNLTFGLIILTGLIFFPLFIRAIRTLYLLYILSFLLKLCIYLLHYSYSHNIIALIFLIELFLLFIPNKTKNVTALTLLFLIWTGLSNINLNWLSGMELQNFQPQINIKVLEWIAAIAIITKLTAPFMVLSKAKSIFNPGIIALAAITIGLTALTRQMYTLLPLFLILYIFIARVYGARRDRETLYQSFMKPEPSNLWVLLGMMVFLALQGLPNVPHPLKALRQTPFSFIEKKVPTNCFSHTHIISEHEILSLKPNIKKSNGSNFICHVDLNNQIKPLCEKYKDITPLYVQRTFYQKKLSESEYRQVFNTQTECPNNKAI